jgi:hypothetical protein
MNSLIRQNKKMRGISGPELRRVVCNRRIVFHQPDDVPNVIQMIILPHSWETLWGTRGGMWDSVASIINEWSAADQIRHIHGIECVKCAPIVISIPIATEAAAEAVANPEWH